MTFPDWFAAEYQQTGESQTHAIHRFAFEHGLGWTTVLRAVKGSRVQPPSARVIAAATGGKVDALLLGEAPTRREIKERKAETASPASEPPPDPDAFDGADTGVRKQPTAPSTGSAER